MKQLALLLIASLMLVLSSESSFAQRGKSTNGSFFASAGPGIGFNAKGDNISLDLPTIGIEVGYKPPIQFFNYFIGIRMIGLMPYSSLRDSSLVIVQADTANGIPASSHYKHFVDKSSTLLLTTGFVAGEKIFRGGINTGVGLSFVDKGNKLGTFAVWDFSLKGGVKVAKNFSIFISSTHSYLFPHKGGDMVKGPGFCVREEIIFEISF